MNIQERGIREAAKAASLATGKYRVGSALLRKSQLVSVGWNTTKTHPKNPSPNSQHAEFSCLHGVRRQDMSSLQLFVVRLDSGDQFAMSKPCTDCQEFLRAAGLRRVVYSVAPGVLGKMTLEKR